MQPGFEPKGGGADAQLVVGLLQNARIDLHHLARQIERGGLGIGKRGDPSLQVGHEAGAAVAQRTDQRKVTPFRGRIAQGGKVAAGKRQVEGNVELIELKVDIAELGAAGNRLDQNFRQGLGFRHLRRGRLRPRGDRRLLSNLWNFFRRGFSNLWNRFRRRHGRRLKRIDIKLAVLVTDHVEQGVLHLDTIHQNGLFFQQRKEIHLHHHAVDRGHVFQQEALGVFDLDLLEVEQAAGQVDRQPPHPCVDAVVGLDLRQDDLAHHVRQAKLQKEVQPQQDHRTQRKYARQHLEARFHPVSQ